MQLMKDYEAKMYLLKINLPLESLYIAILCGPVSLLIPGGGYVPS